MYVVSNFRCSRPFISHVLLDSNDSSEMITLRRLLKYQDISSLDANDPRTTEVHRAIIHEKPLLKDVYESYYDEFISASEKIPPGAIVELGSGGGFLKDITPRVITSDVLVVNHVDLVTSAELLPFESSSISALFLLNVFHHIKDPHAFLSEVERVLKPGGRLLMIEPAPTPWSRIVRWAIQHEPSDRSAGWKIDGPQPVSDSNTALPWIVFIRNRHKFEREFPHLSVLRHVPHTPFRFLLSGGISYKSPVPTFLLPLLRSIESLVSPLGTSSACT